MTERSIFLAALDIDDLAERAAYVARACGEDAGLQGQVEELLRAHQQTGGFMGRPAPELVATIDSPAAAEGPGATIGPYKLLQMIGEGGMGAVFMAEQTAPVKRTVALKVIKAGLDSRQVLARFEAERQALALMDHPNIAKVLDAGTTANGRPYFVMELVKGVAITRFCDGRRLTPRERLELFIPVCQAVQHAHQKGIIHRDLKPSNVLVALYDGRPVPKVIDFGVAKAAGPKLTERTLYTEFGSVIGTLEYMSPEQAELNQLDVDTRSDIYSLGVLLYELLTGSTPMDRARLERAALLEVLRIIREEEPPRPSTRLSTTEELPAIAANRGTEPRRLSGLVRGELDWIVMKALEKDRGRRYETASGFAMDVQRYLADEPVRACSPSSAYRFRKFARRNRATLATSAVVALALVVGTAVSTWQAIRAIAAREAAEKERDRATRAERLADANLQKAREAVDRMLTRVGTEELRNVPQAAEVRKELLEDALEFYEGFLEQKTSDPDLLHEQARVLKRVGEIRHALGQYAESGKALRRAITLRERLLAEHPSNLDYREGLARSLEALGQNLEFGDRELPGAAASYGKAAEFWSTICDQRPGDPTYLQGLARCEVKLGQIARKMGDHEEAERHASRAVSLYENEARLGPFKSAMNDQPVYAWIELGEILEATGRRDEAQLRFRQAVQIADARHAAAPGERVIQFTSGHARLKLANCLQNAGHTTDALDVNDEAITILRGVVEDFPTHLTYRWDFLACLMNRGTWLHPDRRDEKVATFREALDLIRRHPAQDHQRYARTAQICSVYLWKLKQPQRAEEIARDALAVADRAFPEGSREVASLTGTLASALTEQGRFADAEPIARRAVEMYRRWQPTPRPDMAWILMVRGRVLMRLGRDDEASKILFEAAEMFERFGNLGDVKGFHEATDKLWALANRLGEPADRDAVYRRLEAITAAHLERDPRDGRVWLRRADVLAALGRTDELIAAFDRIGSLVDDPSSLNDTIWGLIRSGESPRPLAERCAVLMKKAVEARGDAPELWNTLGVARYRAGDWPAAIEALRKSRELNEPKSLGFDGFFLAMAHWRLGEREEARRWYDRSVAWMAENMPDNAELRRFRAEADALLGRPDAMPNGQEAFAPD